MNAEVKYTGIKCDNQACGWKDETVTIEDTATYLNKPCPNCGENLLTQEDYNRFFGVKAAIEFLNTLSPEQMKALEELTGMRDTHVMNQLEKLCINVDDMVEASIDTHKKITIEISKIDEANQSTSDSANARTEK